MATQVSTTQARQDDIGCAWMPDALCDTARDAWTMLFSYPDSCMPECHAELECIAALEPELQRHNITVLNVFPDDAFADDLFTIRRRSDAAGLPVIVDDSGITGRYDMLHPAHAHSSLRTVLVLDERKRIRLEIAGPLSVPIDMDELLQVIDAMRADHNSLQQRC